MPLLVREKTTRSVQRVYTEDHDLLVWWATETECVSALTRRERSRDLSERGLNCALQRLDALKGAWDEMEPVPAIRNMARRILRTHDVRAGDALQLAAAITASEGRPETLEFITLDGRLVDAARREGLAVVELL